MLDFIQALKQHVTGEVSKEQEDRAAVCGECPEKEIRLYAQILNSKMEELNGYVCLECGCPLATKIFAKEKENICPKWRQ